MNDENQAAAPQQDEPVSEQTAPGTAPNEPATADGAAPSGQTVDSGTDGAPPNVDAQQPVQFAAAEDTTPHPGVIRLEHAQGLPEVPADTEVWAHYNPPAGAIRRFKSVDRRTMEVVMLADEGRGLAARQA